MNAIPVATYRLQLRREFGFAAAAATVPYLSKLGISHLYLSPITAARRGSTHGYDVVDYGALNPELGGEPDFARLVEAVRAHGMGIVVDFVPNHMAASLENAWWYDVLRHGQASRYARHFDIDWKRFDGHRHEAVTLPWLDRPIGESDLRREGDYLMLGDLRLPLADGSTGSVAELLTQQHYRLIDWRQAPREINYRRFFDINDLVGMDVEHAFDDMHVLLGRLARDGAIQGVRLDHVDGLRDPAAYCVRLQKFLIGNGLQEPYLLVEKILEAEEALPAFPGVHGTTGYEVLSLLSRLSIEGEGMRQLSDRWRAIGGDSDLRDKAKRQILVELFPGGLDDLASRLPAGTREELVDYLVRLPVYRTYVSDKGASESDRRIVEQATASPALRQSLLAPSEFVFRLQQFSGPVMAKSVEDTLFYRDFRLLALNEVGGGPDLGAISDEQFHRHIARRRATQPHGLIATATHDTKRGEDARSRIAALSSMAGEWIEASRDFPTDRALTPAHLSMLYQALLGAWPLEGVSEGFAARTKEFALKAVREGKEKSRWTAPDEAYEAALAGFIDRLVLWDDAEEFRRNFGKLAERAALLGAIASLSQLALKATLPGVPDFYQGSEFWDLSFVDPDNRRPVDYAARHAALEEGRDWSALGRDWRSGRIKIALMQRLLAIRTAHRDLFTHGDYEPLEPSGPDAGRVLAFVRRHAEASAVIAVCRDAAGLVRDDGWPDFSRLQATLPVDGFGPFQPLLEFGSLPVAVLVSPPR